MDPQEQLFGLIEAAETQQQAAAAAIAAMAKERRELAATVEVIKNAAGTLQNGLQEAASRGVRDSLNQSLENAEKVANRAVRVLDGGRLRKRKIKHAKAGFKCPLPRPIAAFRQLFVSARQTNRFTSRGLECSVSYLSGLHSA